MIKFEVELILGSFVCCGLPMVDYGTHDRYCQICQNSIGSDELEMIEFLQIKQNDRQFNRMPFYRVRPTRAIRAVTLRRLRSVWFGRPFSVTHFYTKYRPSALVGRV